ncbi:tubulin binding cofactor C-domain-containing protein [Leucosporidium creatinivorum]|uniref:Tubulin binding cofactor C-domain-containing protein n=1 Tax=Leucosporidium creatinivorum TaxID=106004 RepID=A0A1Y2F9T2_9BASI|nr:tubulin binding cofactor C-domain-containing protein [Leucosporidium creatinivorum]
MDDSPIAFVARWTEASTTSAPSFVASPSALATLTSDAQSLGVQLTEQAERVPAYELGRCERELKTLLEAISAAKTKSTAKPKFSFKRTGASSTPKPPSPSSYSPASPAAAAIPSAPSPSSCKPSPTPPSTPSTSLALTDRRDELLTLADLPTSSSSSRPDGKPEALLLSALEGCFVDLTSLMALLGAVALGDGDQGRSGAGGGSSFSALYLYNLKRCVVLVEPIEGSVMLHGCEDCVIVLGCHQFRMHDSTSCKIFLHINSTPIIERCRGLLFGPYPSIFAPFTLSAASSFAEVQDFDHPFASAANRSPNFRVLDPESQ